MRSFLYFIFFLPLFTLAQNTLTINVEGLESADGLVAVGIYNTASSFLKEGKTYMGSFEEAKKGVMTITIHNLPNDTYAVSMFHDINGNKKLDTNFIGIPKEPVAFSNAKMKTFGPPGFDECSFELYHDSEINIPFH